MAEGVYSIVISALCVGVVVLLIMGFTNTALFSLLLMIYLFRRVVNSLKTKWNSSEEDITDSKTAATKTKIKKVVAQSKRRYPNVTSNKRFSNRNQNRKKR